MTEYIPNIDWKETIIDTGIIPIEELPLNLVKGKFVEGPIPYQHDPNVSIEDIEKEIDNLLAYQEAKLNGRTRLI